MCAAGPSAHSEPQKDPGVPPARRRPRSPAPAADLAERPAPAGPTLTAVGVRAPVPAAPGWAGSRPREGATCASPAAPDRPDTSAGSDRSCHPGARTVSGDMACHRARSHEGGGLRPDRRRDAPPWRCRSTPTRSADSRSRAPPGPPVLPQGVETQQRRGVEVLDGHPVPGRLGDLRSGAGSGDGIRAERGGSSGTQENTAGHRVLGHAEFVSDRTGGRPSSAAGRTASTPTVFPAMPAPRRPRRSAARSRLVAAGPQPSYPGTPPTLRGPPRTVSSRTVRVHDTVKETPPQPRRESEHRHPETDPEEEPRGAWRQYTVEMPRRRLHSSVGRLPGDEISAGVLREAPDLQGIHRPAA